MIRPLYRALVTTAAWLTLTAVSVHPQSNLAKVKTDYADVTFRVLKHSVYDAWIDDDPQSIQLLGRQWSLAGEWVAAWLNSHPASGLDGVKDALAEIGEDGEPQYLQLSDSTYLVVAPSIIGNVFIVDKTNGQFQLAWSTGQIQQFSGEEAEILAAWLPQNARHGGRGPYATGLGSNGSVLPRIGKLPNTAKGEPRFYIDGIYAQSAGGTVGAQISVWLWNGTTALPQLARPYTVYIDQAVGTRVEGDLLKVREKRFFRTFYSCGSCEERQSDWTFRLTEEGVEDLGEQSVVPELDAVDELFYRVIHHDAVTDIASPAAMENAKMVIDDARSEVSEKDWEEFPTLGMFGMEKLHRDGAIESLCLTFDNAGTIMFALHSYGDNFFIENLTPATESCSQD